MEIVLEPGNPHDFSQVELSELANQLTDLHGFPTRVGIREERGYGVTFHEVMHVWVDVVEATAGTGATAVLLKSIVDWARRRWKKDKADHPNSHPRPRSVILYDAKGHPIKIVRIDVPDGEPVEEEPNQGGDHDHLRLPPP
jgi:hypothetical protein